MIDEQIDGALARLEELRREALQSIEESQDTAQLEVARIRFSGRKSEVSRLSRNIGRLSDKDRPILGVAIGRTTQEIEQALSVREAELEGQELRGRLETERLDVTLPGTEYFQGYRHPLLETARSILAIFSQMGYSVYEGPEVEWESYNFDRLNFPPNHPARDAQDTFWIREGMLMRTHTSPGQVRVMESQPPPVRVVVPGFVYRNEAVDASHGDEFYQIEGLAVDRGITMADLKGTLTALAHRFFGPERRVRFRPSFFPFTEPSAELDIECLLCRGAGCRSCDKHGWLELLGSGMVHPTVLAGGGYDPNEVSGFAFGMGVERFAMMKYGITDLRMFHENDLRFLKQFD